MKKICKVMVLSRRPNSSGSSGIASLCTSPCMLSKLPRSDPRVIADQARHDIGVSVNVYTQSPVET
jgi:hypothetical protein